MLDGNPYVPAYYKNMRPGNLAGADGFAAPDPRPLSVGEVQHALGHGAIVLDTRSPGAFGGGHVPEAYNVGLGSMLATWVGSLLRSDLPIVLVLERPTDWDEVVTALGRIGYERIMGYLNGGAAAWQEAGLPLEIVEQIDVRELDRRRHTVPDLQIIDVRMEGEWQAGHIAGATFVPLTELPHLLGEIDPNRPTAVICGSGYRSSIASAFLERRGVNRLANAVGGMAAWNAAGLETTQTTSTPAAPAFRRGGPLRRPLTMSAIAPTPSSPVGQIVPPVLTAAELAELQRRESGVTLVDVRSPAEFESIHIPGSYNVPLDQLAEHRAEFASIGGPVVLVCRSGMRARQAETILRDVDVPRLHVLDGGVGAWELAGWPSSGAVRPGASSARSGRSPVAWSCSARSAVSWSGSPSSTCQCLSGPGCSLPA